MVKVVPLGYSGRDGIKEGDSLRVFFTATSILEGELTLWGQLLDIDDSNNEFARVIDAQINKNDEQETSKAELADGAKCIVKYSCDDRWYRGRVMNKFAGRSECYRIHFVDFGNVDLVSRADIRPLPPEADLDTFTALACRFYIADIAPIGCVWKVNQLHEIEKVTVYKELTVKVNRVLSNNRFVVQCQPIVSIMQSRNLCQICVTPPLELRGFVCHLCPSDALSFYLRLSRHPSGETLSRFTAKINNVYQNQTAPKKLAREFCVPGAFCISLYCSNLFARAQIINVDASVELVEIAFLDYGGVCQVLRNSLCQIESQFVNLPPFAVKCTLHNSQITSSAHSTQISNHIKTLSGFGTDHEREVLCEVVNTAVANYCQVHFVRCTVLQNQHSSSGIRLDTRITAEKWVTSIQFDASTRPKAKSPSQKRAQIFSQKQPVRLRPQGDVKGRRLACVVAALDVQYVWLHLHAELAALLSFCSRMSEFYSSQEGVKVPSNPGLRKGVVYVGKWCEDGQYHRITLDAFDHLVRFVDFGTVAKVASDGQPNSVHPDHIYELDQQFCNSPFVYKALVCGSQDDGFLSECVSTQRPVELVFRRQRIESGTQTWLVDFERNTADVYSATACTFRDRRCRIEFVDVSRQMIFIAFEDEDILREQIKEKTEQVVSDLMLYPSTEAWVGQLVLAVFCEDGCIYRARILNTREVECEVEFYDFGTISVCTYDQLFFYDERHFDFVPPLAHLCEIGGLEVSNMKSDPALIFSFVDAHYRALSVSFLATGSATSEGTVKVDLALDEQPKVDFLRDLFESFKRCYLDHGYNNNVAVVEEFDNSTYAETHVLSMASDGCFYPSKIQLFRPRPRDVASSPEQDNSVS